MVIPEGVEGEGFFLRYWIIIRRAKEVGEVDCGRIVFGACGFSAHGVCGSW